ncbi:MAG: four helix bundle protein [Thermotogaceae bacterium]|nr:four helix bundle protein [Thermotogaceae bacterium]
MNQEQLKNRTKEFALRVIRLVDALPSTIAGKNIGNQIMRSGTSVAANYRAACRARSRAEFTAKLGTVVEEAYETAFWLELIVESGILPKDKIDLLHREANELSAIFVASRKTASKSSIINRQSKIGDHR